ncbi:MAG TPA: prepilin-type N-terminal cleavage/methylation domain-containing protein [Candidatus Acidoferrales bacterium]|nr:prepilin-type N-terminal cleavage/methylation domain-containing protein [Candidatus Acidoferrales bacterium]
MRRQAKQNMHEQSGFTLVEMLIATAVLLIGIVSVAKLVPVAVGLDASNRRDSTALVIAQREMDYMVGQPLSATTFADPQGILCPAATVCNLGIPPVGLPTRQGSPVIMVGSRPLVDFSQAKVAGYSFTYADPNDPANVAYDIRWGVIVFANGAKRFMVGVRRQGGNTPLLPVTLDTMVEK